VKPEYSRQIFEKYSNKDFTKIQPVGAELSTDRQTDMTVANSRFSLNCTSKEGHEQTNVLLFHCSIGHLYMKIYIRFIVAGDMNLHKSLVE